MKLSIAFLAVIGSAAAAPIRMRTERNLAEAVTTSIESVTPPGPEGPAPTDDTAGSMSMSMSVSVSMSMDDATGSDDVTESDDVTGSATGVSLGVAAGAAVLGAVALF
jgi:hypothetical protein